MFNIYIKIKELNNVKKKCIITILSLLPLTTILAEENLNPRIVIMDIISNSIDIENTRMFTDVLRTELYKLDFFNIVERGVIQQYLIELGLNNNKILEDSYLLTLGEKWM